MSSIKARDWIKYCHHSRFSIINNKSRVEISTQHPSSSKWSEEIIKMFLKYSFIFIFIAVLLTICQTVIYGSPIEATSSSSSSNRQASDEVIKQIGDDIWDLKRINPLDTVNSSNSNNDSSNNDDEESSNSTKDELDSVASANLLSVLGDLDGSVTEMDLDGVHRQLLQPESSHLLSMNLLPGKRRFDDNTALASTGQVRGNRFIMPNSNANSFRIPNHQHQLLNENSNQFNNYINEALLDDPKLDHHHHHQQQPHFQGGQKMINNQRRNSMPANNKVAERRQLDLKPKSYPNYNNYLPGQNNNQLPFSRQQESSGSVSRPLKPMADSQADQQDPEQPIKDSDIFKDETEEKTSGGAEKRTGGQVDQADYDDNDEADEVDQGQDVRSRVMDARASTLPTKLQQQQHQQQQQQFRSRPAAVQSNPMKGIEDSTSASAGDQDEEIDASNLEAKKSQANVEVITQARSNGETTTGGSSVGNLDEEAGGKLEQESNKFDGNANLGDEDEALAASQLDKSATDLQAAAGHHHGHSHGHYYQYAGVPKKKAWKFGFKRGNHKHTISREEKGYKNKFHSSFKWHAKEKCKKHKKCASTGKMSWHYEHHDKKKHHHY